MEDLICFWFRYIKDNKPIQLKSYKNKLLICIAFARSSNSKVVLASGTFGGGILIWEIYNHTHK
jgi:hypothetical protein